MQTSCNKRLQNKHKALTLKNQMVQNELQPTPEELGLRQPELQNCTAGTTGLTVNCASVANQPPAANMKRRLNCYENWQT